MQSHMCVVNATVRCDVDSGVMAAARSATGAAALGSSRSGSAGGSSAVAAAFAPLLGALSDVMKAAEGLEIETR